MIVTTDFLDHWRTQLLTQLLDGDVRAPQYLLRLWAHCQNRRKADFEGINANAIKAICRYDGESHRLCESLSEAGFIEFVDSRLNVVGWEKHNASLLANWENGGKGGRPKRKEPTKTSSDHHSISNPNTTEANPTLNPNETHGLPMANPSGTVKDPNANPVETHRQPIANPAPTQQEPRRGEKRRKDLSRSVQETHTCDRSATCVSQKPPSVHEVRLYCKTMDLSSVDADTFHDYYTARGWKLKGGQSMKDWQATARNWHRNPIVRPVSNSEMTAAQRTYENGMKAKEAFGL